MSSILRSLRGQVALGVVGGSALMLLTLYASFLPRVHERFASAHEVEVARAAASIAAEMSASLEAGLVELTAMGRLPVIRAMDGETLDRALENLRATSPFFLYLTALTPDGAIVSRPTSPDHVGESRQDRPYVSEMADGRTTFVGEPRMSPLDTISLNLAAAIPNDDGSLRGILMGAVGAPDRNAFFYRPVLMSTTPPEWRVLLLSRAGYLLADSDEPIQSAAGLDAIDRREHPAYLADPGRFTSYASDGRLVDAAIAELPGVGWRVVVESPADALAATESAATRDLFVTTGLMAVVMLVLGMLLAERVSRRVGRLTTALSRHAHEPEMALLPDGGGDELGEAYDAFNRMVSEQRRLEGELAEKKQSLLQAGKMEAMGRLAGGVAHDFNNLLTVILGYAELIENRQGPDGEDAAKITKAAEQAQNLSRSLLAFSRKRQNVCGDVDLNEVARGAEDLLVPLIEKTIELTVRYYPAPVPVRGDRHQLLQTVVNLAVNARDAMPDGGRLTISVQARVGANGDGVAVLAVEDDGEGIDPAVEALIFEPFYTTKAPGEGTGLGLSMARTVVEQLGGWIDVRTKVGEGTRFELCFPHTEEDEAPASPPETALEGGGVSILLVEDQEPVRRVAAELLRRAGHDVLAVESAEEALAALESGPAPDVLLTDIDLPGMDGVAPATRVARELPGVGLALMSGNVRPTAAVLAAIRPDVAFLAKPFAAADLAELVATVSPESTESKTA